MIAFLRGIRVLHFPTIEGDKSADSSPVVLACVYRREWNATSSCRTRHCAPVPSTGVPSREDRRRQAPVAELSRELPSYDPEDRDYLIRTIAFEARARGEGQSVSTPSKRPMKVLRCKLHYP